MIITNTSPLNQGKKGLILAQLKQLELEQDRDFWVYEMNPDPDTQVAQILITIKVPTEYIDRMADELKIEASLTHLDSKVFVKTPFWNG